jgi:hypothetical protein
VAFCAACATSWLSAASVVSCCHTAKAEAGVVESTENSTQEQEHQSARFSRQESFLSALRHKSLQAVCCHTAEASRGPAEYATAFSHAWVVP